MSLQGFTRPISPGGTASLAGPVPYAAARTGLMAHFRANGRPLAHDLVFEHHESAIIGAVWRGQATLELPANENEELLPIQPVEALGGYLTHFGYRATGVELADDCPQDGSGPQGEGDSRA